MTSENTEFPGNAKKDKAPQDEPIAPIVEGRVIVRKKSPFSKLRTLFSAEDAQSVGSYVMYEVMVPALKNLINDMVSNGIERALWGEISVRSSRRESGGGPKTNYRSAYQGNSRTERHTRNEPRRELSQRSRSEFDFRDIILDSRGEAEDVILGLSERLDRYDMVKVADLYQMCNITPEFTDENWGWFDLEGAKIVPDRSGYRLRMPRPEPLD